MQKKEFKLMIEGFNKYLLNEHTGHTQKRSDLIAAVPQEFSEFINDNMMWFNGDAWMAETDHGGNTDSEDDEKLLFEAVAKACGCNIDDLLVHHYDALSDELDGNASVGVHDLTGTFIQPHGNSLCGEFTINGAVLKGFFVDTVQKAVTAGLQFKSQLAHNELHGLIFVAPNCAGIDSDPVEPEKKKFKLRLGGAWN